MSDAQMKVLFISNLFPDAQNPNRGIYNAQLLKHLAKLCEVRVLAPRPTKGFPPFWFPKQFQSREQDRVFAPIFAPAAYIPKFGSRFNHVLMADSIEPMLKAIREDFPFDVVLSSWIYPDGCAVAELAHRNGFPFVAVAQGSDVHRYLKIPARRKIITTAMSQASAIVARSHDLSRQLREVVDDKSKLHVIYNGVDFQNFCPADRSAARKEIGLPNEAVVLLFVGNLLPIKNPLLLIEAHAELCRKQPNAKILLVMIGSGPLTNAARERANALGTDESVSLVGGQSANEVARYMQAADLLCVPSNNEGVPNVILEAFACGLRVVARKVGGISEILSQDFLGKLVEGSDVQSMSDAIEETLATAPNLESITQHARQFSWNTTAQRYYELLHAAASPGGKWIAKEFRPC